MDHPENIRKFVKKFMRNDSHQNQNLDFQIELLDFNFL